MILYKKGGFLKRFFGNSQDKFSDMAGAGGGIDMSFKGRGPFAGKGSALRREKRQLKRLEKSGQLGEEGSDRLDYLRNVQKDRAKKIGATAALTAGAAFGASALAGGLGAGAGGGAGAAGAGAKGGAGFLKGFGKKFGKNMLQNAAKGAFGGGQQAPAAQNYAPQTPSYQSPQPYQAASASVAPAVNLYGSNGMRVRKRPINFNYL
jgi:hypothetical protein